MLVGNVSSITIPLEQVTRLADRPTRDAIPSWLVKWGDISWRLIAIGLVVYFAFQAIKAVSVVAIAVILALFLASVLWIPVRWLVDDANWPPILASLATMVLGIAVLSGGIALLVPEIASNVDSLNSDVTAAWQDVEMWLIQGPFGLSEDQIDSFSESALEQLRTVEGESLLGGAAAVAEFFSGFFLAVIATFFVLKDGRPMLSKLLKRLPEDQAKRVKTGVRVGWHTLSRYVGGLAVVGLFDAVAIAIGLLVLGVPLVVPLATLVFFGAFFPLIGAFLSGLVAVAVAFVNGGWVDGLIIFGVVVVVQQFEGDVIMPIVFGKTLRLHPLVILLGVAAGGLAFGLFGAFLAVPLIALVVSIREALHDGDGDTYLSLTRG